MKIQTINTKTYAIAVDDSSKATTFDNPNGLGQTAIITNLSDQAVFIVAGNGDSAPTAVFPTSATVPVEGKIIPAGAVMSYSIEENDKFISAIQLTAGTGNLYISTGNGV